MKNRVLAVICMLALVVSLSACASAPTGVIATAPCEKEVVVAPEVAKVIKITEHIMFDWDSSKIRADQEPVLKAIAGYLVDYPDTLLVIEGYASIEGTDEYNLALSSRRAEAVRADLHSRGVAPASIKSVVGKGETTIFGDALKDNRKVLVITVD